MPPKALQGAEGIPSTGPHEQVSFSSSPDSSRTCTTRTFRNVVLALRLRNSHGAHATRRAFVLASSQCMFDSHVSTQPKYTTQAAHAMVALKRSTASRMLAGKTVLRTAKHAATHITILSSLSQAFHMAAILLLSPPIIEACLRSLALAFVDQDAAELSD